MRGTRTVLKTLVLLATLALLIYGSGWLSTALAQYPPPAGTVTAASDADAAPTEGSVDVTCTVLDTAGAPVAGELCTFTIESQPGTDATIGTGPVTEITDANGVATATLYVGSTPGDIVVEVEARGLSSQVTVTAGGEPGIAPPAAPSAPVSQLPATGGGGIAGMSGDIATKGGLVMGAVAAAAMVTAASAYLILRRRAAR
jgi:hypothetical protein